MTPLLHLNSKRPLSPHLTVYAPQLTSTLSIFHRITGVLLFLVLAALVLVIKANVYHMTLYPVYFISVFIDNCGHWLMIIVSMLVLTMINYHMLNGIRHLFWDILVGLKLRSVYFSGYFMLLATFVLTYFLWFSLFVQLTQIN